MNDEIEDFIQMLEGLEDDELILVVRALLADVESSLRGSIRV